jgi:hypothetical protein
MKSSLSCREIWCLRSIASHKEAIWSVIEEISENKGIYRKVDEGSRAKEQKSVENGIHLLGYRGNYHFSNGVDKPLYEMSWIRVYGHCFSGFSAVARDICRKYRPQRHV